MNKNKRQSGMALLTTVLLLLLMSSLLVGFVLLIRSGQQLSGVNNDYGRSFYAAQAGMEKMTADLGDLFSQTYAPSAAQVLDVTTKAPVISGIQYTSTNTTATYGQMPSCLSSGGYTEVTKGGAGYLISYPTLTNGTGNPAACPVNISSGVYQGMSALATTYTMTVTARTDAGSEVKLQRTTQTVGIPMFQFGIFSNTDLSFFPGPSFSFGGRTHTNGSLYLGVGNSSTLTLGGRVTAVNDVVRNQLSNGYPTSGSYAGTVNIATASCTQPCTPPTRSLALTEGSSASNWSSTIVPAYKGFLNNHVPPLNLGITLLGGGTTQAVDLIRRANSGENSDITNQRLYAQASLRVLLSDDPSDIMNLPCIDSTNQPFDLSQLAQPVASWPTNAQTTALKANLTANGAAILPLAASGAANAQTTQTYTANDGYMLPKSFPIIKGFIKIEAQLPPYNCAWKDVTMEILGLGYVGKNINPVSQSLDGATLNPQWIQNTTAMETGRAPNLPNISTAQQYIYQNSTPFKTGTTVFDGTQFNAGTCLDPHPLAIIRMERIRDNPSSVPVVTGTLKTTTPKNLPAQSTIAQVCGVDPSTSTATVSKLVTGWTPAPTDFWPTVLFDTREGTLRDKSYTGPTLSGAMHYIEIDGANLTKWFAGTLSASATSGPSTKDPVVAPNNFVVYVSDRRGNYTPNPAPFSGGWPPVSYSKNETGEYGWDDFVNSTNTTGCPNNGLDQGEDVDESKQLYTYGANPNTVANGGGAYSQQTSGLWTPTSYPLPAADRRSYNTFKGLVGTALTANADCGSPTYGGTGNNANLWPMVYASNFNVLRENPPLFFRRAIKIVNGSYLANIGTCSGSIPCGLTIATENPAYVMGNFNSTDSAFTSDHIATAVMADAVTLLSNSWSDVNSFAFPYTPSKRAAGDTYYRLAIMAGKGPSFKQPYSSDPQDFGTDGGVHNFLRYLENWSNLYYRGSIISMYYNRQAVGVFKCCTTTYGAPTRNYKFDLDFQDPSLLPPRTPLVRDTNTTGFSQLMLPTQ